MAVGPKEWSPRGIFPSVDPRDWFILQNLWDDVRAAKENPDFEPGVPWLIEEFASGAAGVHQSREVAEAFQIPRRDLDQYVESRDEEGRPSYGAEVWDEVLLPFLDRISEGINRRRPADIPGRMSFGWLEADNSFGLMYFEEA